jgi:hypothetical protein
MLTCWYRPDDNLLEINARVQDARAAFADYEGNLICQPFHPRKRKD